MGLRLSPTATAAPTTGTPGGVGVSASLTIGDDPSRPHTCQPSSMDKVVDRAHPLYRRPAMAGQGRTRLMQNGWSDWILDPPSEQAL